MPKEKFKFEKIEKARIPDEDMPNWIKTLREGGFTDEEIDSILSNLSTEYKKAKNPNFVEEELSKIRKHFLKNYGRILTHEETEYLKKSIESRFED